MARILVLLLSAALSGCVVQSDPMPDQDSFAGASSMLTSSQRRNRAGQIRDAAAANGINQGWLLAGIADAETTMAHCHSELTWACRGPSSPDCGGGPVVAGSGDGPCSLQQGGLGMFQFDAGTYSQTLAREGNRILSVAGNVAAAVDFTVNMVIRSTFISGVSTRAQAIDWMNSVTPGSSRFTAWYQTVTRYYNGCSPSSSCWSSRTVRYRDHAVNIYNEMGADFWRVSGGGGGVDDGGDGGGDTTPGDGTARGVVYVNAGAGDLSQRIEGARITVRETEASATVGADGSWAFELPAGTYTIEASATGFVTGTRTCTVTSGTVWCSLGLDRGRTEVTVTGVVYEERGNGDTSERLSGASVRIASTGEVLSTDASGTWSKELEPGAYQFEISADGYQSAVRDCVVEAGTPAWCSQGLQPTPDEVLPAGRIIGVVYVQGSISTRVPGATVRVRETGEEVSAGDGSALWFFDLPGSTYTIDVSGAGFMPGSRTCTAQPNQTTWCSIGIERAGRGGGLDTVEDERPPEAAELDAPSPTWSTPTAGGCSAGGPAGQAPWLLVLLVGALRRRR